MLYSFSQLSNGIVIFITWSAVAAVADNQQDRNHGGTYCFELKHCGKVLIKCCSVYLELCLLPPEPMVSQIFASPGFVPL